MVILITNFAPVTASTSGMLIGLGIVLLICAAGIFTRRKLLSREHSGNKPDASVSQVDILAHEIRTPLSLIKASTELLENESAGPLTEDQRKFVATIHRNADHVIAMAEGFLTSAKLDSGRFEFRPVEFDLRELTRQTAREIRDIYDLPILLSDPGDPLLIVADRNLMRQVVWNLMNNAVRHAGEDSQVHVRTYPVEEGCVLEVRDTGLGISPEESRELFEPFAQSTNAPTAVGAGAGLGLGIIKKIVEIHGGNIVVDSLVGKGTSFHVLIPKPAEGR